MTAIINVVLPVFAIMLAGYLAGRFRLLGHASSDALNRFVYYCALPALFVVSLARVGSDDALNWSFVVAFSGGLLATFVIALSLGPILFANRLSAISLQGLSAIFANVGYMGIPLLVTAFGEAGRLPAIIGTVIMGAVVIPVGVVLIEIDHGRGAGLLAIIRRVGLAVARSPLVIAAALGLTLSLTETPLPTPIVTFCDLLGAAAGPCALFAIGLFMVGKSLRAGLGEVVWMVMLKLVVQPLITWYLAYELLEMPPLWSASAVIMGALPTGALVFVLAQQYDIYVQRSTAAIILSTVISVVTLSVLFAVLGLDLPVREPF